MSRISGKSFMVNRDFIHGYRLGGYSDAGNGVFRTRRPSKPSVEVNLEDQDIAAMVRRFRKL